MAASDSSLTRARRRSRANRSASRGIHVLVCARCTSVSNDSLMNRSMVSVLSCPSKRRFSRSAAVRICSFSAVVRVMVMISSHVCACRGTGWGSEKAARWAAAIPAMSRATGKAGAGAEGDAGVGVEFRWTKLANTADAPLAPMRWARPRRFVLTNS